MPNRTVSLGAIPDVINPQPMIREMDRIEKVLQEKKYLKKLTLIRTTSALGKTLNQLSPLILKLPSKQ